LTGKKLDQKEEEKEKDIAEKKSYFLYTRSRRKENCGINNNFR
jgi:hypothetical protein